jgi:hypothetical protein
MPREHNENEEKDCGCHDKKDPCCNRSVGAQGPQGVQGPRGQDGLQGPQGVEGPQGIPGQCVNCPGGEHPCDCPPFGHDAEFAQVYSLVDQNLDPSGGPDLAGGTVLFEQSLFATANIDLSNAAAFGEVRVNKAGWYEVLASATAFLNVLESPLPAFALSLYKNGALLPASSSAGMTISPEQRGNQVVLHAMAHFDANDILKMSNTSNAALGLNALTLGVNVAPNSASLRISMLRAD